MKRHRAAATALRIATLGLLLAFGAPGRAATDAKAAGYYEDALLRYEKGDMRGAVVQLKNVLQIDNKMLSAHVLLGKSLLATGDVIAAEAALHAALGIGVDRSEVVLPLAEALTAQGKLELLFSQPRFATAGLPPDVKMRLLLLKAAAASDLNHAADALKLLDEARQLDPQSARSWAVEVPIRVRAGQLAEARAAAARAVALDPKSPQAAYQQATVAHVAGDLQGAVELYTRTLGLKPDHVDALVARAGLYVDLRRLDEAGADIRRSRQLDAKDPRSTYLAALLAERAGDSAATKQALNEVTALLDPLPLEFMRYRPQVLMLGGMSHFGLGQLEKAKPYLEMLLRQDPNSPVAKLLARIYLADKSLDKAATVLDRYLRAHPNDADATLLLASTQMAQGRYARSAELMQQALKKTDDASMRSLLGMSLVGVGKFESGAAQLEATLAKDPGQVSAGVTLAGLYLASGQTAKAVKVADALAKRQPKNPGLVNLLGSARAAAGDAAGARQAFEGALELDPGFVDAHINLARLDIDLKAIDAARERLHKLLAKDDKNMLAALEMARSFAVGGRDDEALRWLQRADDHSGQRLDAGLRLVDFHLARGRVEPAREAIKKLRSKAPENLAVLQAEARVLLAANAAPAARTTLNRAATLAGYDAALLVQIAQLQVLAGDAAGAAHALDKALEAKPGHLRARALRAHVHVLHNEPAKAEQLARGIVASDPGSGLGHTLLGEVARSRHQGPAAIEAYRSAHRIDRSSDSLLRLLAVLEPSQPQAATTLAEQWLRDKPQDQQVWRALADMHARAGKMAAARDAYQSLIKHAPQDAEAMNNLAIVLIGLRDPGAAAVAERALALKPQTPYIIGTAGWAAYNAGQPERALQLLRDARLRDPTNASTRYFLATVLAQQGRKTEAREEIETALRANPGFAYTKDAQALLATLR